MGRVLAAAKHPKEDCRMLAMQTLAEVARQEYESVQYYLENIFTVTRDVA
jgi:hypothetical protein